MAEADGSNYVLRERLREALEPPRRMLRSGRAYNYLTINFRDSEAAKERREESGS